VNGAEIEDRPGATVIPLVASIADLSTSIPFADENPCARWYVAKRAVALGAPERVPPDWRRG
jgi:hypothetical protein